MDSCMSLVSALMRSVIVLLRVWQLDDLLIQYCHLLE